MLWLQTVLTKPIWKFNQTSSECAMQSELLKASRSSHTYYTLRLPPPPTQHVVHRRSRLKFLSSTFDPLNAAVVAAAAPSKPPLWSAISFYNIALPSFLPSLQVLLKMGRFYQVTAMVDITVGYTDRWNYCTRNNSCVHVSYPTESYLTESKCCLNSVSGRNREMFKAFWWLKGGAHARQSFDIFNMYGRVGLSSGSIYAICAAPKMFPIGATCVVMAAAFTSRFLWDVRRL